MEKNVILYIRVSSDEQKEKGYSLQAQELKLRDYCKAQNWKVLAFFSEDHSAWKGFERPEYRKLKEYATANKKVVDYILFTQWSRFSRDISESFREIGELKRMNIEPNAIEQWVDLSIPENLYTLSFYLAAPQVENDRLSLRTKAGMRQAVKQGRWLWKAPYGYTNDTHLKLILPDIKHQETVKYIFSTFITGAYTIEEVRRLAIDKGCTISKQSFIDVLKNPLYAGLIPVRENGKITELYDGLHEALISKDVFEQAQAILSGKKKPYQGKTSNDELPLKGSLICPKCNKLMTGSASKGNGGLYHYYHCQRKYGCNNSIKATYANAAFEDYLNQFQFDEEAIYLYNLILEDVFNVDDIEREKNQKRIELDIEAIKRKIEELDEMCLAHNLPMERYNRMSQSLEQKENDLIMQHATIAKSSSEFKVYIRYASSLLSDVSGYYKKGSVLAKQKMIGSIFPEKIVFEDNKYRTTKINEAVALIVNVDKGYKRKKLNKIVKLSSVAPESGLEPETL